MDLPSILSLVFLIILSGIFSSLEIAFFSLNHAKIDVMIENKKKGAKLIKKLKNQPERLLTTILIGNNVVNILSASLATAISIEMFGNSGIAIATFIMTIVILMFGEILPKSLAATYAENFALIFGYPLFLFQICLAPIVYIFETITRHIMNFFGVKKGTTVSDDELDAMAKIGVKEGSIEKNEQILIRNVLRFNDIEVGQIMTPRVKMVSLDSNKTIAKVMNILKKCHFSRIPVFNGNDDNITGIFYVKDILNISESSFHKKKLKDYSQKPLFTAESIKIDDLFKEFKMERTHIAIVLDEHGGTAGLITLEDIIEELVGEIDDETDKTVNLIKKINKNTILANAEAEMKFIADIFDIDIFEQEELNQSLNGYLINHIETIPEVGHVFEKDGLKYTIEEATEKMIKKVRVILQTNTPVL